MSTEKENKPKPEEQKNKSKKGTMRFENFLASVPLYVEKHVIGFHEIDALSLTGFTALASGTGNLSYNLKKPSIQLFCPSPLCNGIRCFEVVDCSLVNNDIWGILRD